MAPSVAELLAALPADPDPARSRQQESQFQELLETLCRRPVPTGRLRRLWSLSGLQTQVALAYGAYFIRAWFRSDDRKQQDLLETNLRSALKTFETMAYLRGAVMKIGQAVATFSELIPEQFAQLLGRLHFDAPPMHYSLLREHVQNELGKDPEDLFDWFETTAFAAASLGQVHRARLKTGASVAVKIQYPGIARTIRADVRNLIALLFPLRLANDWDSFRGQLEEVRRVLESETDYEQEAESLRKARTAFGEDDAIVVPRVHDDYCTKRILTMEYLDGASVPEFLAQEPGQPERDHFGGLIHRAATLLFSRRRMYYSDFHPGNFLRLQDGRLGLIDLGGVRYFNDQEWEYLRRANEAMFSGDRDVVLKYVQESLMLSDQEMESKRDVVQLVQQWAHYYWEPPLAEGPFDFGDPNYLQRGMELWKRAAGARVLRQRPVNVFLHRGSFELIGLMYQLRARVDCGKHYRESTRIAGWGS